MKNALLNGKIDEIGALLDLGFKNKKQMAQGISNESIDELYDCALQAGASGGKINGAGGGGFMMFYCPGNTKYAVANALKVYGGWSCAYQFTKQGLYTWQF